MDRETEELKHDKIPLDLGRLIQQGRQAKGWSQKELATVRQRFRLIENLCFKVKTVSKMGLNNHNICSCVFTESERKTTSYQRL